jgi:hypothetical protein
MSQSGKRGGPLFFVAGKQSEPALVAEKLIETMCWHVFRATSGHKFYLWLQ